MFRPVDRHGRIASGRLSGEAVSLIVKERVAAANIDPSGFSGHSLRAAFATSAVQAGVSTFKIRQQTGHASDTMLSRYVRDGELFLGNAAGTLLYSLERPVGLVANRAATCADVRPVCARSRRSRTARRTGRIRRIAALPGWSRYGRRVP